MDFKDKKVLVSGMAKSGIAAAELLNSMGARVILQDTKTEAELSNITGKLREKGIELYLGGNPDDIAVNMDLIVMSPGVPCDLPFVKEARTKGVRVIGEMELGYRLCKAPLIAITGTNGKTTTTSLVGEICRLYNEKTAVVGNIGNPLTACVNELTEDSMVVAELSSFQLETIEEFKPVVSAVLNITPDHLNRHKTLEGYIEAKERVFENQTEADYCILNYNDCATRKMAEKTKARVVFFAYGNVLEEGIYSDGKSIYVNAFGINQRVIDVKELNILGAHNVENAMAAVGCCLGAGIPLDTIVRGLKEFKAVEHRIEFVKEVDGVAFYNDSKGTNPDASIKAVQAMERPICLIAGGYDKGSDFDEWIATFKGKVKYVAVIGAVKEKLCATMDKAGFTAYERADDFLQAIDLCFANAKAGDCVLLSPACASWDMFKSYEQRGEIFKDYVCKLGG